MSDHLGLYEMLFILGIGAVFIGFELYSVRRGKDEPKDKPPESRGDDETGAQ